MLWIGQKHWLPWRCSKPVLEDVSILVPRSCFCQVRRKETFLWRKCHRLLITRSLSKSSGLSKRFQGKTRILVKTLTRDWQNWRCCMRQSRTDHDSGPGRTNVLWWPDKAIPPGSWLHQDCPHLTSLLLLANKILSSSNNSTLCHCKCNIEPFWTYINPPKLPDSWPSDCFAESINLNIKTIMA